MMTLFQHCCDCSMVWNEISGKNLSGESEGFSSPVVEFQSASRYCARPLTNLELELRAELCTCEALRCHNACTRYFHAIDRDVAERKLEDEEV